MSAARRIIFALVNPNLSIFEEAVFAVIETVYMAFMATVVAVPISFIISFPAARNLSKGSLLLTILYSVIRFFLNPTRSIEPLVWAIIFSVWVGIGPFAGMLALALHSVASLAKLYSEQIESIDDGPMEAIILFKLFGSALYPRSFYRFSPLRFIDGILMFEWRPLLVWLEVAVSVPYLCNTRDRPNGTKSA